MKLYFSRKAERQFDKLNPRIQQRITSVLNKFQKGFPIDIKKLKNKDNEFRIRTGNYRLQLESVKKDFWITKIAKRENFYSIFLA